MFAPNTPCLYMTGEAEIKAPCNTAIINSQFEAVEHSHSFIEILYFESGQGKHIINGKEYNICPGDIYLINADVYHSYSIIGAEKDICVKNCIFRAEKFNLPANDFIKQYYRKTFEKEFPFETANFVHASGDRNKDIWHLLCLIENELELKYENYEKVVDLALECVLIKLFRKYALPDSSRYLSEENISAIETAIAYIKENYAQPLTLSEVAKKVNFSENYFNSLFKKYTSMTMKKYHQKIRCQEACRLLSSTNLTIEAICEHVGYLDVKQFFYIFKRLIGVNPGAYRKTAIPPPEKRTFVRKQKLDRN